MDNVSVKFNHIKVEDILIDSDFYPCFIKFLEEYDKFQIKKKELQNKISTLIDIDENHRIGYIYFQHMLKKGKYKLKNIPRFDAIESDIRIEIVKFIDFEDEMKSKKLIIEEKYKDIVLQYSNRMFQIFEKNHYLNNALLITNYGIYKTLLKKKRKDLSKLWKIVMRAFAKTAPLSTYTSIAVEHDVERNLRLDELILIRMYYYFIQLEEIIEKGNFVIDYEIEGDKLITKSFLWQLEDNSEFIGNRYKLYSFPLSLMKIFPKGSILSGEELINILGGKTTDTFKKIIKLYHYGFIKNTLMIRYNEPTLQEFMTICTSFANASERVNNICQRLINVKNALEAISKTANSLVRRREVESLNRKMEELFYIIDGKKGIINKAYLTENSYGNKGNFDESTDDETKKNLEKISAILPIFDPRILLKFYIKDVLKLEDGKLYEDIKESLINYLNIYERDRDSNYFKDSIFTQNGINRKLYGLYELYEKAINKTIAGHDVALKDSFLDNIASELLELGIPNSNYYNFSIQKNEENTYFLNNLQCNYLSFIFQHYSEKEKNNALENLKARLNVTDEILALYSPSYGFNPNTIAFDRDYELVSERIKPSPKKINVKDCLIEWREDKKNFQLLKDGKRFIPIYLGTLAGAYLTEDLKIVNYLSQSQFLTGISLNYNNLKIKEFMEIGEIRYNNIVIQRSKKIINRHLMNDLTEDFEGYLRFYKFREKYKLPDEFFIRLYPVMDGRLTFIFGKNGLHKPVFIDSKNALFYEQMINHINSYSTKYDELAVVFEEAAPNPYKNKKAVYELSVFV